jgi:hypothetical protein
LGDERADVAHRGQLHREAQPVVIAAAATDQPAILVVEEEERSRCIRDGSPLKRP